MGTDTSGINSSVTSFSGSVKTTTNTLVVPDFAYLVNQKGQSSLIFEENIFYVNRRYENTVFWQCSEYKRLKCKCRCTTTGDGKIKRSLTEHNHPSNKDKVQDKIDKMKSFTTYHSHVI